ncbi:MAG: sigma-54 dependent transcriptional regulator [Thermoguttaceae bacterium]|jgi:two-component system nitrogen regulation response regulator GlnG|nr:sigma-54 dependent transcriptional regulator [Thermoguttaceae bacterium]
MATVLVVDDEPSVRHVFSRKFDSDEFAVVTASSGEEALRLLPECRADAVVLDVMLPDRSGLDVFRQIREIDSRLPVIFMTAGGTSETAIEAMTLGAFEYLLKPLDFAKVRGVIDRALTTRRLMCEPVTLSSTAPEPSTAGDAIIGRSPAMQEVYKAIGRVAPQMVTVLVRGESGTGKELVARAVYQHSRRSDGPFLVVNCAAIPETLLESELFGHERGSFTGAERRRIGKFEQCSGGTLFLDEIGDMPMTLQSKILRVLQDQHFERVGGNETVRTNVRIIAATNRNLETMVAQGVFRSDLYYRLNVYTITLPSLRERLEDIELLVAHFVARANAELEKQVRTVAPDCMELLRRYTWPGNVRELQSVIRRAVLGTTGPALTEDGLPEPVQTMAASGSPPATVSDTTTTDWDHFVGQRLQRGTEQLYDEALALMEQQVITRVLRHVGGNQVQASKILGITRTTLRAKMRQLGLTLEKTIHETPQDEGL